MSEKKPLEEVTVWMWACPTHGVQPVHLTRRGSRKRICRTCGERLYETFDPQAQP